MLGDAVKVTVFPELYLALQVEPQLMVPSLAITIPAVLIFLLTLKQQYVTDETGKAKFAATDFAEVMVTMQEPVPEHAPDQPVNVDPLAAEADNVTDFPDSQFAEHVQPQLIRPSLPVTVPVPVPGFVTVRLYTAVANVAVTDVVAVIDTVQVPVPEQPPPCQPVKTYPLFVEAVKVTDVADL